MKQKIALLIMVICIILVMALCAPIKVSGVNNPQMSSQKEESKVEITSSEPVSSEIVSSEAPASSQAVSSKPAVVKRVPTHLRDFKSYTYYKKLNRASGQWKKIQTIAYSDANGLRKVDDYYCVAMGSYYTKTLGDLFKITTSTGNVFEVIITDFKSDRHTDVNHQYTLTNQCMVEFYVDYACFNPKAKRSGSISSIAGFEGKVVKVEYIGNYFVV